LISSGANRPARQFGRQAQSGYSRVNRIGVRADADRLRVIPITAAK